MNDRVLMQKELDRNFAVVTKLVSRYGSIEAVESVVCPTVPRGIVKLAMDRKPVTFGIIKFLSQV